VKTFKKLKEKGRIRLEWRIVVVRVEKKMTIMVNKKVIKNSITIVLIDSTLINPLSVVETSVFKSKASNIFEWDRMLYIISIVQMKYFNYLRCTHINIVLRMYKLFNIQSQ